MRLASDIIAIKHRHMHVRLRPSLRAAFILHKDHGIPAVADAIVDQNLGIIIDVLMLATDQKTAIAIVTDIMKDGIRSTEHLVEPLIAFVFALLGKEAKSSTEAQTDEPEQVNSPDWIEPYLEDLFEKATGWLGWSPSDSWSATPREIQTATRGLVEKLKAIHGSADAAPGEQAHAYDPNEEVSPEQVRAGIAKLRTLSATA